MVVQVTVLKVYIACQQCKKELMLAVSTLEGVDKIEVDEEKETLTVTGEVDPYQIIVCTRRGGTKSGSLCGWLSCKRRRGNFAKVVSIGPPKKPDDDAGKDKGKGNGNGDKDKPEGGCKCQPCCMPPCPSYKLCEPVAYIPVSHDPYGGSQCSLM